MYRDETAIAPSTALPNSKIRVAVSRSVKVSSCRTQAYRRQQSPPGKGGDISVAQGSLNIKTTESEGITRREGCPVG